MHFLTGFGDLAVLLPLAAAVLMWLMAAGAPDAAARWVLAVAFCTGGIGLLKMYFFACSAGDAVLSPSGHSGFAALVYGVIVALLSAPVPGRARLALRGAGALFVAGIALSRLALRVHTPLDVATGLLIGLAALAFFLWDNPGRRVSVPSLRPLTLALAVILLLLHGRQLHAEEMLHTLGLQLKANTPLCSLPTAPARR